MNCGAEDSTTKSASRRGLKAVCNLMLLLFERVDSAASYKCSRAF